MTRPEQLQTTFMKALNDGNRTVRLMAGSALGYLIAIHMRPGMTTLSIFYFFYFLNVLREREREREYGYDMAKRDGSEQNIIFAESQSYFSSFSLLAILYTIQ